MKRQGAVFFGLLATLVFAAYGQVSSSGSSGPNGVFRGSAGFSGPAFPGPVVTGAPYSGESVSEHVQTLADGTHITQKMTGQKTWRDSQGRTRTERQMGGPQMANSPTIIQITDPVAGYQYTLDSENRVAHRVTLTPPGQRLAAAGGPMANRSEAVAASGGGRAGRGMGAGGGVGMAMGSSVTAWVDRQNVPQGSDMPRPQMSSESLGTQMIDGILAEGRRMTTVYPTGMQGNDAPIRVVSETWMSPELKLVVLSTNDDPRSGVNTQKIVNLSRAEPDPSLFMVPPGYSMVDETGPFSITYGDR